MAMRLQQRRQQHLPVLQQQWLWMVRALQQQLACRLQQQLPPHQQGRLMPQSLLVSYQLQWQLAQQLQHPQQVPSCLQQLLAGL